MVPGHEAVGRVLEVGGSVTRYRPGDPVLVPVSSSCDRCGPCARGVTARREQGQLCGWGPPIAPAGGLDGAREEGAVKMVLRP